MFQVALGKEKPDELGYSSVTAMVAHHKVLKLFQNTQTTLREGDWEKIRKKCGLLPTLLGPPPLVWPFLG